MRALAPPAMTTGLTPAQTSVSLLGLTAVSLILALILRRRVPTVAASLNSRATAIRGGLRGRRTTASSRGRGRATPDTGMGNSGAKPLDLLRHLAGWTALALFAVAGVAASGTFIGTIVLWCARRADSAFHWLVNLFPGAGHQAATLGFSLVAILALWRGLHLLADLIEGKAHHGDADLLVFLGPMLFTLVPGYFGQGATWVYAAVAAHVGPLVAHLV